LKRICASSWTITKNQCDFSYIVGVKRRRECG